MILKFCMVKKHPFPYIWYFLWNFLKLRRYGFHGFATFRWFSLHLSPKLNLAVEAVLIVFLLYNGLSGWHCISWVEHTSKTQSAFGLLCEQGEAKSAELIGQAIANNPAFLALRQIEAARETSHTISASTNKVFLDSNDLLLNLQQLTVANKQKKWSCSLAMFWVIGGCHCKRHCEENMVLDVVSLVVLSDTELNAQVN